MQSIYRPMLKNALTITWRFKYLWFFGLFATLFGNGGIFNLIFNNMGKVESQGIYLWGIKEFLADFKPTWQGIDLVQWWAGIDTMAAIITLLMLVAAVFLLWLSICSQAALVYGVKQSIEGRASMFGQSLRKGMAKFWPVFLINILAKILTFVILTIISVPLIILFLNSPENYIWQNILVILAFIVWVPIAVILAFLIKYAVIYSVNQEQEMGSAISQAWKLFKSNWIASIELAFILLLVTLVASLAFVILTVFIALPFVMLGMIASYAGSSFFMWTVLVLGVLTFLVLMFIYGAALNVFQTSAWVILFEKIQMGPVYSKVLRWATWLTSRNKGNES